MNQAAIGQYIAGKRTAQGMTQEQLAQKIGVSQKSLMRWETGKRLPDADAVEALCTALGITLPELLNGKDSPQKEEMQLTHDAQMLDLLRRMQRQAARLKQQTLLQNGDDPARHARRLRQLRL